MGVTVLGIQHKVGEFEGIHYDNYNLHCVEGRSPQGERG